MKHAIKSVVRPWRDAVCALWGYGYDMYRFLRYAGYKGYINNAAKRDYKAIKIYHRLEKCLSFREQRKGAGVSAADDLIRLFRNSKHHAIRGFHEIMSLRVLKVFARNPGVPTYIGEWLSQHAGSSLEDGGTEVVTAEDLGRGVLADPEEFFFSRHSIRDFAAKEVPEQLLTRAVKLAIQSPSVCNRQGWFVYTCQTRATIDKALSLQNGNAGFGHEIPALMIVCFDIRAFDTGGERNQGWIDGGMFCMSLISAFHALGVGSCCLNWSKTPGDDRRIRKMLPIKAHHTILMMIGVGFPNNSLKVCASARRPVESFIETL